MDIIKASEEYIGRILNLCQECSQNLVNNSIDQWDEVYPNKEVFLADWAIRLDVFVKNQRAVSFYSKLGYEVTGKITF